MDLNEIHSPTEVYLSPHLYTEAYDHEALTVHTPAAGAQTFDFFEFDYKETKEMRFPSSCNIQSIIGETIVLSKTNSEGIRKGFILTLRSNGIISSVTPVVNDNFHGMYKSYDQSGCLIHEEVYKNGFRTFYRPPYASIFGSSDGLENPIENYL
jgi:hypothetical protein